MSRELFGTDGVRGIAGEYPLNNDGLVRIGRAVGVQFAQEGEHIVIACDTRESSQHLVQQVALGLQQVGVQVVFVDIVPTPGLAYLTAEHPEFVAGVMITASHNTYEFNGVKVFSAQGGKLPDDAEAQLNANIEAGVSDRGQGSFTERPELAKEYEDFLVASAGDLRLEGLKIAIDTAHGAASFVAPQVLTRLGAEVVAIGNQPDGRNINIACGATHTELLQETVLSEQCDLGIALDGDADRLIMVDNLGRECTGDHLLYLLGVGEGHQVVVATVMSNLGFEHALNSQGIELQRTGVGDRYVLERLIETGRKLGGEQSGHIILADRSTTGDGLLAAIQVLRVLKQSGKTLAQWRDEVHLLPQSLVNFAIADKTKLNSPEVEAYVQAETEKLGTTGRILVRASGTEPLARVMVEAPEANALAQEMADHIAELVR
ncbi:MAG: phosphoglucosamine mutase [Candidatus Saccharimonadales bacterium]